jgi:hypothetical protein
MIRHPKADWFEIRYYRWGLDQALRDSREGFPRLRLVNGAVATANYRYLAGLGDDEREALIRAMAKRFHPRAVELEGESMLQAEERLLDRKDTAIWTMGNLSRPIGTRGARAGGIRKGIRAVSARIGERLEESKSSERFEQRSAGWSVRTVVVYSSNPSYIQFVLGANEKYLRDGISILSWLGVAGQSAWDLAFEGQEANTSASMVRAATYFLDAAQGLLGEPS